jgi:hypothetical protein
VLLLLLLCSLQVSCGGTAEADNRLLQTRLLSIQQHSSSSDLTSNGSFGSMYSSSSGAAARLGGLVDSGIGGPVCKYYLAGSCGKGSACPFRHARPVCKFFLSRTGCIYGSSCRFLHGTDSSSSASDADALQLQEQGGAASLWFDWLPDSSSTTHNSKKGSRQASKQTSTSAQGTVVEAYREELLSQAPDGGSSNSGSGSGSDIVLLGEGDFTFTSALVSARQAAGLSCSSITATVLESDVNKLLVLYPRTQLLTRMLQLMAAGRCGLHVKGVL